MEPDLDFEKQAELAVQEHVLTVTALGIYDPLNPRRPRVPVKSFQIELLELDDDLTAHAAGPVVLGAPTGDIEKFLRVSIRLTATGEISPEAEIRAAYIEETNPEIGACKETAALANA